MAKLIERFQPSFVTWPLQNNRTAFQPVNVPLVLVVPFTRDPATNEQLADSGVTNLKFFIEDAPGLVPVAGFEHTGVFVPDLLRFSLDVSPSQLQSVLINLTVLPFFDKITGAQKSFVDAQIGDFFEYTLNRGLIATTGPRDRIEYLPDAIYYDLSTFIIETLDLKPLGRYRFSWQCNYFNRIITQDNELFCIDNTDQRLARFSIVMIHPGEIHQMMIEQTPSVYFQGTPLDQDTLIKFYRPFADALQDIFDEQDLMVGINFIDKIPAQFVPYLAYLIGWDLPFFPGATDNIRRAVLKNGRRLQQLKGSRRVIRELFELFGYTIDIVNLWYSRSGTKFIGPGEKQPPAYKDEEIEVKTVCQTEILLANYNTDGFGGFEIPLLFKPNEDITIDAWLVKTGSLADQQLTNLLNTIDIDPEGLMAPVCAVSTTGALISAPLQTQVTGSSIGYSQVIVTQKFGAKEEVRVNEAPLSIHTVKYNRDRNLITLGFDHNIDFNDDQYKLYAFATYTRQQIVVPQKLTDLRSNRFDIAILFNRTTGASPDSALLDFLLDFIFKLKAFHSLLRKITYTVQVIDIYNVTDFCLGGRVAQAPGTDLGELQTIPAIIPTSPGSTLECNDAALKRGFKDTDFALREEILRGLKEEHKTWKNLDGTHQIPDNLSPILASLERIQPNVPDAPPCEFTKYGQDRVIDTDNPCCNKDFDHRSDERTKLCDDTNNILNNCFTGRVHQDTKIVRTIVETEIFRPRPCELMLGKGFYYTHDVPPHDLTTIKYGQGTYDRMQYGEQEIDLTSLNNLGLSQLTDKIIKIEAFPDSVDFTGTNELTDGDLTNDRLAIRRPSLEIDRDNLFFPGHRFVVMSKLENDFIHPIYSYRPWDSIFYVCPERLPIGAPTLEDLDPHMVLNSNGDEVLIFNEIPYEIFGNGLEADISSLGDHIDRSYLVTHAIFSTAVNDPAIDSRTEGATDFTTLQTVCFGDSYGSIFTSANTDCECDNPTQSFIAGSTNIEGADFIDGYPSEFGRFSFDSTQYDYPRGLSSDVDLSDIGLPVGSISGGTASTPATLLFRLGSGIKLVKTEPQYRFYKPFRLDCGCMFFNCPPTGTFTSGEPTSSEHVPHVDRCLIPDFFDKDGDLDPNTDRLDVDQTMILEENVHANSIALEKYPLTAAFGDQEIHNLLSFDPEKLQLFISGKFPPSGNFFYVDPYGIINEGSFETEGNRIDITVITKDPRVWGEEPTGYIKDGRVYRKGTITTCRQILELVGNSVNIIAAGCNQIVDFFQSTFQCGDKRPSDPFAYHCDNAIFDGLEIDIVCGPGWPDTLGGSFTIFTVWPDLVENSYGVVHSVTPHGDQPFEFVNAWSNLETLQTLCPQGTGSVGSG